MSTINWDELVVVIKTVVSTINWDELVVVFGRL